MISNPTSDERATVVDPARKRVPARLETPDILQKPSMPCSGSPAVLDLDETEICQSCHRRAFCQCAQKEWREAEAIEQRVWVVLSLCGAATILYAAYCFLFRG